MFKIKILINSIQIIESNVRGIHTYKCIFSEEEMLTLKMTLITYKNEI